MTRMERQVHDFFERYGDIIDVSDELQVIWLNGDSVLVAASYPGEVAGEGCRLTLSFESEDYAGFIKAFASGGDVKRAIYRITVADLVRLFEAGKGSIVCSVDEEYMLLWFQKNGGDGIQVTDNFNAIHEIDYVIQEPGGFIKYTQQYYNIGRGVGDTLQYMGRLTEKDRYIFIN
jgi:hypothetical protein